MAVRSITAASAVYMLGVTGLFGTPQQLQGFAADEVWGTDPLKSAEVLMGVDGILSGGFVYVPIEQTITLQADSASNLLFDAWWNAMQGQQTPFPAQGTIRIRSVGSKYILTRGFLTTYQPLPDAKKLLQPRKFGITWNAVTPAAIL